MNTSEQILVVALATVLAVLLIVLIIAAVQIVRLLKVINRITEKAEHLIDSAENVAEVFNQASGPLALFRVVQNVVRLVSKHKKR